MRTRDRLLDVRTRRDLTIWHTAGLTAAEMCDEFRARGVFVSEATVARWLEQIGL